MAIQGIIRPPPEIRAVADKTASFVAKNGRAFETKIINSSKGKTPKFAFLHSSSPFHAYYEDRIVFYANGGVKDDATVTANGSSGKEGKKDEKDDAKDQSQSEQQWEAEGQGKDQNGQPKISDNKNKAVGGDDLIAKAPAAETTHKMTRKAKSIVDPIAKALLNQRAKIKDIKEKEEKYKEAIAKGGEENLNKDQDQQSLQEIEALISSIPPPQQIFTTSIPPKSITQAQLEIIKLTAQFVAMSSQGSQPSKNNPFLRTLSMQEWNNPLYGFTQPRHSHYAYFCQLIDLYRYILQRSIVIHTQRLETMKNAKKNQSEDLTTATATSTEMNDTDADQAETSLLDLSSLQNMVGLSSNKQLHKQHSNHIQSIQKTAGNTQACLENAAYQTEYYRYEEHQKRLKMEKKMEENGGEMLGGVSRVDWHDFIVVETIDFDVDEVVESLPPPPPPPPLPSQPLTTTEGKPTADEVKMDESSDEEEAGEEEKIQVVSDYQPKVVSSQAKLASEARTHVIDPITGKSIPIADMSEHMRIQLLDPKWAAEKERFMEKQKDSNLVGGDMIARNVNAFTKARGDLFGSSAEELLNQEQDSKRRLEEANRLIREQSVIPPPLPPMAHQPHSSQHTIQFASNPSNMIAHERPSIALPDAKRTRIEGLPNIGYLNTVPPTVPIQGVPSQLPPPPPPPTLPSTPQIPPSTVDENDTETIQTVLSESDFYKSLADPTITLHIKVPDDSSYSSWNFNGQVVTLSIDAMTKIKALKQKLQSELGDMPVNKMQLKSPSLGYLKDASSLAKLNIRNDSKPIELVPKIRGGRK